MSLIFLRARAFFGLLLIFTMTNGFGASGPFLQMRDNYFWDPQTQDYFIARGIAYQLWNPPVGANQSFEQLTYDLEEFKKNEDKLRPKMNWTKEEWDRFIQGYEEMLKRQADAVAKAERETAPTGPGKVDLSRGPEEVKGGGNSTDPLTGVKLTPPPGFTDPYAEFTKELSKIKPKERK